MKKLFTLTLVPGFLLMPLVFRSIPSLSLFISQINPVALVLLFLLVDIILVSLFLFSVVIAARLVYRLRHESPSSAHQDSVIKPVSGFSLSARGMPRTMELATSE